jgi:hypothetical protein
MIALLRFIASNSWLIILICLLGAARSAWGALGLLRVGTFTPYSLERESVTRQVTRAWATTGALLVVSLVLFAASPMILESTVDLPSDDTELVAGIVTRTPTPLPRFTPTPIPPTLAPTLVLTPSVVPTVQPTAVAPEATATLAPAPPAFLVEIGCPDPRAQFTEPAAGQLLSGAVTIQGTADIPKFSFYKFEIKGPLTNGEWWTLGELARAPVNNGVLGNWDAAPVAHDAPGLYLFRLTVVDDTGNYPPPCTVPVRIAPE